MLVAETVAFHVCKSLENSWHGDVKPPCLCRLINLARYIFIAFPNRSIDCRRAKRIKFLFPSYSFTLEALLPFFIPFFENLVGSFGKLQKIYILLS
jgi:hypothetical protein